MDIRGKVLVTGGTGFIGNHVVLELLNANYEVLSLGNEQSSDFEEETKRSDRYRETNLIIEKLCTGHGKLLFKQCNLLNLKGLNEIFLNEAFSTVIHLASLKGVADSITNPTEFYRNNLLGTLNLLMLCKKYNVNEFIFASSATVYGDPEVVPVNEFSTTGGGITNPYGRIKHMTEQILLDLSKAEKNWCIAILRLFDPAGNHPSGLLGETLPGGSPKHLMPFVAQVASGKRTQLQIFGNHFKTKDGTGSRDFVHVVDVAKAHVCTLEWIRRLKISKNPGRTEIFNIGLGKGHTVLEMVEAFEKASGRKVNYKLVAPRPGDIGEIFCDPTLTESKLLWKPSLGIDDICKDLWKWESKN